MITITISFERGPNAPENAKFSVGMPRVSPIPPKADTSSNTDRTPVSNIAITGSRYSHMRKRLNHGALSSSMILVRSMIQIKNIPETSHHIS